MAVEPYLYLTTQGRKSGKPREIEIWFTEHDGCCYIIAEYDTSDWLQNLRAHPQVQVRVGSRTFAAVGRVLSGDSKSADESLRKIVQDLSRAKYGWGDGTVVELRPSGGDDKLKSNV